MLWILSNYLHCFVGWEVRKVVVVVVARKEVGGITVRSYLSTGSANIILSHEAYDLEGVVISHLKKKKFASF